MPSDCPFCDPPAARVWLENSAGIALLDAFPVAEGHTLIIPKEHVASLYELTENEQVRYGDWLLRPVSGFSGRTHLMASMLASTTARRRARR